MWEFGVGAAVAAVLVAGPVESPLTDLRDLEGQPCTLPVSGSLSGCPDPDRRPPVSCVLPASDVTLPHAVEPHCPPYDPSPESRVLPVGPATR